MTRQDSKLPHIISRHKCRVPHVWDGFCRHERLGEKIDWMLQILLVHRYFGIMHHANLFPGFQFPEFTFYPLPQGVK